jgi:RimJ/RimL family protein N-acetyltransferase
VSAFLSDGVVNLRPVMRADLPQLAAWRNDPELRARTREFRPLTDVDQERWLERISGTDRRDFMFVVERVFKPAFPSHSDEPPYEPVAQAKPKAIGVVGLCHWDAVNASAEVSFYIGDTLWRKQGLTKRALQLLHAWGFTVVGLHRIWAECYDFNGPGHRVLKSLGYTETGSLRDTVRDGNRWWSSVMYDLLEDEWRAHS